MNTITFGVLPPCIRLHLRNMDIRYSDQLPVAHNRPRPYPSRNNTAHLHHPKPGYYSIRKHCC